MKKSGILRVIYSAGFIFTVHTAFLAYINSSFLSKFVGEDYVGFIFTAGAFLSILLLGKIPDTLSRFGNLKTTIALLGLELVSLFGLTFLKSVWFVIPVFILHYAFLILLKFNFDIFVEQCSTDKETGGIRGAFLSINSMAWVISPIIVGAILTNSDFWKIYLLSGLLVLPVGLILYSNLKKVPETPYEHPPFWHTLKRIWNNKDIYKIFVIGFLLQFFFGWMVIYTPIYLNQHMGFAWDKIGYIFTIMLLPYVLFEFPLGKLADKWFGEKEFLSIGFVIVAFSTGALTFITSGNWMVWAGLLFITRIGGSFVEIMSESYFFKQIDGGDANIIGFFRNTRPLAYIFAPLIAVIFLEIFPFKYLFLFLGIIMLSGLWYALTIKDTK